jgi:EAL domain-containing protein (putative c-di-GMP-specific phosphodiesterase class I)
LADILGGRQAPEAAQALGEAGFSLVLDDAACSPVCLGEWLGLPVAALGVRMAWVRAQVADSSVGPARVQALIRVAHAWGAQATATGVDMPQDLTLLRRLGVDTARGLAVSALTQAGRTLRQRAFTI